jgi:hypothetical protein
LTILDSFAGVCRASFFIAVVPSPSHSNLPVYSSLFFLPFNRHLRQNSTCLQRHTWLNRTSLGSEILFTPESDGSHAVYRSDAEMNLMHPFACSIARQSQRSSPPSCSSRENALGKRRKYLKFKKIAGSSTNRTQKIITPHSSSLSVKECHTCHTIRRHLRSPASSQNPRCTSSVPRPKFFLNPLSVPH